MSLLGERLTMNYPVIVTFPAATDLRSTEDVTKASKAGHHVPGTPYTYRHGWIPLSEHLVRRDDPQQAGGSAAAERTLLPGAETSSITVRRGTSAHRAAPLGLVDTKVDPVTGKVKSKPGPGMTPAEARSLSTYREAGFIRINRALRKGKEVSAREAQHVTTIDDTLRRSKLTDAIEVSRGIGNGPAVFGSRWEGDLTGVRFTDRGYVSATTSRAIASEFAHRPGVERETGAHVTLSVPAGVGAVSLSGQEHESEILLDRNLTFEVVSDSGPGPDRQLRMVVVG